MPRYIDADTVVTIQVYNDMTEEYGTKRVTIADAIDEWSDEGCPPFADVVEVVRCKDCKYHENERIDMVYCPAVLGVGSWVENDWFCKDGERRE